MSNFDTAVQFVDNHFHRITSKGVLASDIFFSPFSGSQKKALIRTLYKKGYKVQTKKGKDYAIISRMG
jgi:hypothetical protein